MKLSELKEAVDHAVETQRRHPGWEDLEVVIVTDNPNMGGDASVAVQSAWMGSDWNAGRFWIRPSGGVVKYRTHEKLPSYYAQHMAKARLQELKDIYEEGGQKYIAKSREQEWIDGFAEGFWRFSIEVAAHGEK